MTAQSLLRFGVILIGSTALAACAGRPSSSMRTPTPPPMLIASRGVPMPLAQAMQKITLRPKLPNAQILAFAVIPPLGGADTPAHRGIAIEYVVHGGRVLLSEWPRAGFTFAIGMHDITQSPCTLLRYSPTNVMWENRRNVVMTLQPDGPVRPNVIDAQARRLLASGTCEVTSSP